MSREMATAFFPVTIGGLLKNYTPEFFYYLFPDWVAERCPMPYVDLQFPGYPSVPLFWPAAAAAIVLGFLSTVWLGSLSLLRVLREGAQSRQGLFLWSASLLWYGCMCVGGLFFHCLHVYEVPHLLDLVGTGLSSLSVVAGFAAFAGVVDDRTGKQRLGWVASAAAFAGGTMLAPPPLQEQLYMVPALLAAGVGGLFFCRHYGKVRRGEVAMRWLWLGGLGVVLGIGALPLDKWLCVVVGANFTLLFWFFLGCDIAILSTYQFAIAVRDNNLHFGDVKAQ